MDERQCQHYRYWERNRVSSTSHGKCKPSAIDMIRPTRAQHRMWLFAQEYVVDSHGTNAAIRAGYAERSAHVMASQLLRNPNVSIWIAEAQELKARSRDITIERVLEEYRRIAFAQTTDMVTLKGGWVTIGDTAIEPIISGFGGLLPPFYHRFRAADSPTRLTQGYAALVRELTALR